MSRLKPYIFTGDIDNPRLVRFYLPLHMISSNLNIIWELNGGFKSASMDIYMTRKRAYKFYKTHLGDRIVFMDGRMDMPVADGFITGISIKDIGVEISVNGHWFRHNDSLYNFDDLAQIIEEGTIAYSGASSFTDDGQTFSGYGGAGGYAQYEIWVVNDDNTVSWGFVNSITSATEISVTSDYGLTTAGWNGTEITDKTPLSYQVIKSYDYKTTTDIIKEALTQEVTTISDDQSNIEETNTIIAFWEPNIEEGGLYPSEVIDKLSSLSDSSYRQWNYWLENQPLIQTLPQRPVAHFEPQVDDGTYDWGINVRMTKDSTTSERNIQELRNAIRVIYNNMEDGETTLEPDDGSFISDTESQSTYWTREAILNGGDSYTDIAAQYGGLYLNKYKDAIFANSFTINSTYIYNYQHHKVGVWYPIKYNRSYFKFLDLGPDAELTSKSLDRKRVSQAMVMEYSDEANSLRVVLDSEDNRVDALLARVDAFR